jgi:hypothetical protein
MKKEWMYFIADAVLMATVNTYSEDTVTTKTKTKVNKLVISIKQYSHRMGKLCHIPIKF